MRLRYVLSGVVLQVVYRGLFSVVSGSHPDTSHSLRDWIGITARMYKLMPT